MTSDSLSPDKGRLRVGIARRLPHGRSRFVAAMLIPSVIVLVGITLYPTIMNIYQSLFRYDLTHPKDREFVFLQNYGDILFHSPDFWHSAGITAYYVALVLVVELLLGFAIASILSNLTWGRGLVTTIIVLPMAAAPVAISFVWRFMFNPSFGILDHLLASVGLPKLSWLSDARLVIPALALVDVWQWTPFMILILTAGLMALPLEPFEAAMVDGASKWQSLIYLTLPMMRPFILVALLFRGIDAFKAFDYIFILTKGGPGNASETLNMLTFQTALQFMHIGYASAMAVLMLIFVTVFCMILVRRLQVDNEE
jgi:multiple sugar transport system permease protein